MFLFQIAKRTPGEKQHRCKLVSVGTLKQLSSDQFTLAILFENMGMKSYSSYMGIFHRLFSEISHRYHFHGGLERQTRWTHDFGYRLLDFSAVTCILLGSLIEQAGIKLRNVTNQEIVGCIPTGSLIMDFLNILRTLRTIDPQTW